MKPKSNGNELKSNGQKVAPKSNGNQTLSSSRKRELQAEALNEAAKSPEFSKRTIDAAKILADAAEIKRLSGEVARLQADKARLIDVGSIAGAKAVAQAMTEERDRVYDYMHTMAGTIGPLRLEADHLRRELRRVEENRDNLRDALAASERQVRELLAWKRKNARAIKVGVLLTKPTKSKQFPLSREFSPRLAEMKALTGASIKRRNQMAKKPKGGRKGGRGC